MDTTTDIPAATNPIADPALRALAVATDTRLSELATDLATIETGLTSSVDAIHHLLGHRARYITRTQREWPTTSTEAIDQMRARLTAGDLPAWDQRTARTALDAIEHRRTQLAANRAEAAELNEVWADNGHWSRFFLVLNNNGHVHYDVSGWRCSRRMTTAHGWNPQLSGLTDADAVAQLGPLLCTVCFPSAPVEWTVGKAKPARCPGSGQPPVAGTTKRRGRNTYGECTGCGDRQIVTLHSGVRAHKPPKP